MPPDHVYLISNTALLCDGTAHNVSHRIALSLPVSTLKVTRVRHVVPLAIGSLRITQPLFIMIMTEEDRGNSFNHMSAKRPSRLAVTNAIALSSASGVGSRSPALIRGTLAPAVRLAQHPGVAPLKSEAYRKNKASPRIGSAPRVEVVESIM